MQTTLHGPNTNTGCPHRDQGHDCVMTFMPTLCCEGLNNLRGAKISYLPQQVLPLVQAQQGERTTISHRATLPTAIIARWLLG